MLSAVGKQRTIRRHWALEPRDKGSILAFPFPSCANSQTLYVPTFQLPLSYYENTYYTDLLGELSEIIKKWDVIYAWHQPGTTQTLNKYGSPISWLLEWLKKWERLEAYPYFTVRNKHVLWDVTERGWEWACSRGIRRWTQMGLSTLPIQLPLAKCQTQWQAIRADRNRTWYLPWGTHSLGWGNRWKSRLVHQGYHTITQRMREPTPNSLNAMTQGREACAERQAPPPPRGGSVFDSLTLLTKIHSVPSTC